MTILQDVNKPTQDELMAELARLTAENHALKANGKVKASRIKVYGLGEKNEHGIPYKGTLGVRMGRHSAVFYAQQWLDLLDMADEIRQTIETNKARLSWKED